MPTTVPRGSTPRQYFLSARAIEGYRHGMVIGRERERILRRYPGTSAGLASRRWLRAELPKHSVKINGKASTYSIADAYPVGP
ncbi:MAG: hypothetical protein ACR2JC_00860 [Chloroflexota bacterium]